MSGHTAGSPTHERQHPLHRPPAPLEIERRVRDETFRLLLRSLRPTGPALPSRSGDDPQQDRPPAGRVHRLGQSTGHSQADRPHPRLPRSVAADEAGHRPGAAALPLPGVGAQRPQRRIAGRRDGPSLAAHRRLEETGTERLAHVSGYGGEARRCRHRQALVPSLFDHIAAAEYVFARQRRPDGCTEDAEAVHGERQTRRVRIATGHHRRFRLPRHPIHAAERGTPRPPSYSFISFDHIYWSISMIDYCLISSNSQSTSRIMKSIQM